MSEWDKDFIDRSVRSSEKLSPQFSLDVKCFATEVVSKLLDYVIEYDLFVFNAETPIGSYYYIHPKDGELVLSSKMYRSQAWGESDFFEEIEKLFKVDRSEENRIDRMVDVLTGKDEYSNAVFIHLCFPERLIRASIVREECRIIIGR